MAENHMFVNESDFVVTFQSKSNVKSENVSVLLLRNGQLLFYPIQAAGSGSKLTFITGASSSNNNNSLSSTKPIFEFHIRKIKFIYSPNGEELNISLSETRVYHSLSIRQKAQQLNSNVNELICHIRYLYTQMFPHVSINELSIREEAMKEFERAQSSGSSEDGMFANILRLGIFPITRLEMMDIYYPNYKPEQRLADLKNEKCGGYCSIYSSYCHVFNTTPRPDIVWIIDSIWHDSNQRLFDVSSLGMLENSDYCALFCALEANLFFEKLHLSDLKLNSGEAYICLVNCLKVNSTLQEILLRDFGVPKDFWMMFADALLANRQSKINSLQLYLQHNDEKFSSHLGSCVALLPSGICSLLVNGLNKKCTLSFLNSLKKRASGQVPLGQSFSDRLGSSDSLNGLNAVAGMVPPSVSECLMHLDLSNNQIGAEGILVLADLLAQPNEIRRINLQSASITNLEVLFGALARGCLQELQSLSVEGGRFSGRGSGGIDSSYSSACDQFFHSSQKLAEADLSNVKLSQSQLKSLLNAIKQNHSIMSPSSSFTLKLCHNDWQYKELMLVAEHIQHFECQMLNLDLSYNNFDSDGFIGDFLLKLSTCKCLTSLELKKTLYKIAGGGSKKLITWSAQLKSLIQSKQLRTLDISENDLKQTLVDVLSELENSPSGVLHLNSLNISHNAIGDHGALAVAKLLPSLSGLKQVVLYDNGFTVFGWQNVVSALIRNRSVIHLNIPNQEFANLHKSDPARAESIQTSIRQCLSKNQNAVVATSPVVADASPSSPSVLSPRALLLSDGDSGFSLQQKEVLDQLARLLKRLSTNLRERLSCTAEDDADRIKYERALHVSQSLLADSSCYSTVLDQMMITAELAVKKVLESKSSTVDSLSRDLASLCSKSLKSLCDDVNSLVKTQLSSLLQNEGTANAQDASFQNQLDSHFDAASQIGNAALDLSTRVGVFVDEMLNAQFQARVQKLLVELKAVIFDQLIAHLRKNIEILQVFVSSDGKISNSLHSLNSESQLHTRNQSVKPESKAADEPTENTLADLQVTSKPLQHLNKGRPVKSYTARRKSYALTNSNMSADVAGEGESNAEPRADEGPLLEIKEANEVSTPKANDKSSVENKVQQETKLTTNLFSDEPSTTLSASPKEVSPLVSPESGASTPAAVKAEVSVISQVSEYNTTNEPSKETAGFEGVNEVLEVGGEVAMTETPTETAEESSSPAVNKSTRPKMSMAKRQSQVDFKNALNDLILRPPSTVSTEAPAPAEVTPSEQKNDLPDAVEELSPKPSSGAVSTSQPTDTESISSAGGKKKKSLSSKLSGLFSGKRKDSSKDVGSNLSVPSIQPVEAEETEDVAELVNQSQEVSPPINFAAAPGKSSPDRPESIASAASPPGPSPTTTTDPSPSQASPVVPALVKPMHAGMKFGVKLPFGELPVRKSTYTDESTDEAAHEESPFNPRQLKSTANKPETSNVEPLVVEQSRVIAPVTSGLSPQLSQKKPEPYGATTTTQPASSAPPPIIMKKPDVRNRADSLSKNQPIIDARKDDQSKRPSVDAESRDRSSSVSRNAPSVSGGQIADGSRSNKSPLTGSPVSPPIAPPRSEGPKKQEASPSQTSPDEAKPTSAATSPPKPIGVKHGVKLPFADFNVKKPALVAPQAVENSSHHETGDAAKSPPVPVRRGKLGVDDSSQSVPITQPKPTITPAKPPPIVDQKPNIANRPYSVAVPLNDNIDNSGKWQKSHLDWMNDKCKKHKITLSFGTKTDLIEYFKDGVSLLEIMEGVSESSAPKYRKNAVLPVHKIDNMNIFLQYLQKLDVQGISSLTAEDLLNGDPKKCLILLNALEKKYP